MLVSLPFSFFPSENFLKAAAKINLFIPSFQTFLLPFFEFFSFAFFSRLYKFYMHLKKLSSLIKSQ